MAFSFDQSQLSEDICQLLKVLSHPTLDVLGFLMGPIGVGLIDNCKYQGPMASSDLVRKFSDHLWLIANPRRLFSFVSASFR